MSTLLIVLLDNKSCGVTPDTYHFFIHDTPVELLQSDTHYDLYWKELSQLSTALKQTAAAFQL